MLLRKAHSVDFGHSLLQLCLEICNRVGSGSIIDRLRDIPPFDNARPNEALNVHDIAQALVRIVAREMSDTEGGSALVVAKDAALDSDVSAREILGEEAGGYVAAGAGDLGRVVKVVAGDVLIKDLVCLLQFVEPVSEVVENGELFFEAGVRLRGVRGTA